jgi:hypothetical protein
MFPTLGGKWQAGEPLGHVTVREGGLETLGFPHPLFCHGYCSSTLHSNSILKRTREVSSMFPLRVDYANFCKEIPNWLKITHINLKQHRKFPRAETHSGRIAQKH